MQNENWKLETLAVQGTYNPTHGEPRVLPLVQNTTYAYDCTQEMADLFDLKSAGHLYTRISNPTVEAFEAKMALLEGGSGALACASGQAAVAYGLMNICRSGQHIVATRALYGGSYNLLAQTLPRFGITCTFVDQHAGASEIAAAIQDNTRCLFAEALSNPGTEVLDFEKFSAIAHAAGIPLIVDNTFPTPYLCRPLELGADIVVHSSSKYIDGHATSLGGVLVDGGRFDWTNGKFPEMTTPDPSYHGICYHEAFKAKAYIVKARVQLARDLGAAMAPMNAWLSNLGLETLHLRMERHCTNAVRLAQWLAGNSRVQWVKYPGLPTDRNHALAQRYLGKGASGVLSFGVRGGAAAGERFMDSLRLTKLVAHVADVRTSALHPASSTHRQLSAVQQEQVGVSPELIRVSVGLEHIDDIIDDFDQALRAANR